MVIDEKDAKRFWGKVDRQGPGDCWEWMASGTPAGYGRIGVGGKGLLAHRVSAHLSGMPVKGVFVCHTCDNPPCCNPAHLFVGTRADNIRDARDKGRLKSKRGSENPKTLLNEETVLGVRHRFAKGASLDELVKETRLTPGGVRDILRGRTWRHVGGPLATFSNKGSLHSSSILDESKVLEIRKKHESGFSLTYLSVEFGVSRASVSSVCRGLTWSHVGGPLSTRRRAKLSDDQIKNMRSLRANGAEGSFLSDKFGVTREYVYQVCLAHYRK